MRIEDESHNNELYDDEPLWLICSASHTLSCLTFSNYIKHSAMTAQAYSSPSKASDGDADVGNCIGSVVWFNILLMSALALALSLCLPLSLSLSLCLSLSPHACSSALFSWASSSEICGPWHQPAPPITAHWLLIHAAMAIFLFYPDPRRQMFLIPPPPVLHNKELSWTSGLPNVYPNTNISALI